MAVGTARAAAILRDLNADDVTHDDTPRLLLAIGLLLLDQAAPTAGRGA